MNQPRIRTGLPLLPNFLPEPTSVIVYSKLISNLIHLLYFDCSQILHISVHNLSTVLWIMWIRNSTTLLCSYIDLLRLCILSVDKHCFNVDNVDKPVGMFIYSLMLLRQYNQLLPTEEQWALYCHMLK